MFFLFNNLSFSPRPYKPSKPSVNTLYWQIFQTEKNLLDSSVSHEGREGRLTLQDLGLTLQAVCMYWCTSLCQPRSRWINCELYLTWYCTDAQIWNPWGMIAKLYLNPLPLDRIFTAKETFIALQMLQVTNFMTWQCGQTKTIDKELSLVD